MVFAVPPWFIDASRRQPQGVSWEKTALFPYNTPASNGANRHSLLTDKAFNLQLRGAYSTLVRRWYLISTNSL